MTNAAAKLPRAAPPKHGQPFGWGNDELSKFLEAARQNEYATFFKKRSAMATLVAIERDCVHFGASARTLPEIVRGSLLTLRGVTFVSSQQCGFPSQLLHEYLEVVEPAQCSTAKN